MRNLRRFISMVLVLCTLLSFMTPAVQAVNSTDDVSHPFTDVKKRDWYNEYVTYVWEKGLFNGVTETTFAPNDKLTRGMFVTVLARMAKVDTAKYSTAVFDDVDPTAWYGPYVAWAAGNGITTGTGDGLFSPDAYVTRDQIATFILRYLALIGYDRGEGKTLSYADSDQISDYAQEAVAVCSALGLFEGDTNNRFRPKDHANRAEAATICARLHQMLNGSEQSDKDTNDDTAGNWSPIIPDNDATSGSVTTYHKISFANPDAEEFAADVLPDNTTVETNSLVYTLPVPQKDGYVFCGWYYDSALTQLAATTDTITANTTLYPKMVERIGDPYHSSIGSLNYVASLDVDPDFTIQVQATSEDQIRNSLTFLNISDFDSEVYYTITSEGNNIYTLTPTAGLTKGNTYQITAIDRDHDLIFDEEGYIVTPDYVLFLQDGEVQSAEVRYYNITVHCEEYSNLRFNDSLIFLPYNQVSGFSFDDSSLFSTDLETINTTTREGTFVYEGTGLKVDDVVAIYDGILNQADHTVQGNVAYAQITAIHGTTYEYVTPDLASVVFMPNALPVPMDDQETTDVDGAFFNKDGTITVYNEYLDFSAYANIEQLSLDGNTTARIGDYLVLYAGDITTTSEYSYWEITGIKYGVNSEETIFTAVEVHSLEAMSAFDVYQANTDTSIDPATIAELEEEVMVQALNSGFAEQAATYLAQTLLNDEELQEDFGEYTIQSFSLRSSSPTEGKEWYEGGEWDMQDGALNIQAGKIEAGFGSIMVELGDVDVHVHITETLKEITYMEEGIRIELGITFPVQIGTYQVGTGWADCIFLEVSASFVQEVSFDAFASIHEEWDTVWIIPYISEVYVTAGIDFGTYTGVGATFTVAFDNQYDTLFPWTTAIQSIDPTYDPSNPSVKSIAKKLEAMMNDTTSFLEGHEGDSLITQYQDLLAQAQDMDYVDILAIKIFNHPIPLLYNIIQIRIIAEFAISAKMSVTMGMSLENLSVKRFSMSLKLFSFKATTKQIDLQTPYTNLNFYVMGNIGLRAGPRITFQLEALGGVAKKHNLVNVGANISVGPTIDLYGIFFYHFRMEKGKTTDSRGVGALETSVGMYLDVDFFFGAFLDLVSANLHALDLTYYFWRTSDATRILEPKQMKFNCSISNDEVFTIFDRYLWMNTLKVRTGQSGTRYNLTLSDFDVALSNSNFKYDAETGTVSVTPPDDTTMKMNCEIRLTYKGSDTLFVTSPITITINLTWSKTKPKYAVRFYSDTYLGGTYTDGVYSGFNYWADWDTMIKETVYVAGDEIDFQSCAEPSKPGYDFAGWRITSIHDDIELHTDLTDLNNLEGYIMPEGNIDIAAFYTPRTDTPYTVEYYVETTAGSGAYELYKSVEHTGRTGSADYANVFVGTALRALIAEDTGTMDGYKINYNLYPKQGSGEWVSYGGFYINGDGSTVVKVYFDRKEYSVYFHVNNDDYQGSHSIQINGVYGSDLNVPTDITTAEVPGWTFLGWADSAYAENANLEIPTTIPSDTARPGATVGSIHYATGTHYFGVWKPNYNYITVNHYLENADGTYTLVKTQVGSNESEETHKIGALTGSILDPNSFLIDLSSATYSHCVCTTADGIHTRQVTGATSALDKTAQHNGQTLDIYYSREYYRYTWKSADRNLIQYYYEGQDIVAPEGLTAASKQGYVVDGWKNTINLNSTEIYREEVGLTAGNYAMIFEPNYVGATDTPYTVIHKRISLDVNGTDEIETEILYGTTDTIVTPSVKTYDGHVSPEATQLYIKADGTATLTYKYTRRSYGKTLDFNGGTEVNYAGNYFYDTIFELPTNITKDGYVFAGWALQNDGYEAGYDDGYITGNCLTSMQDLTFVAQWEKVEVSYTVEHYLENLDASYDSPQTYTLTGLYLDEVTATAVNFTGFTLDKTVAGTVESGTLSSTTDTLVLKLYYTRNSYDACWYNYDGTTLLTTTQFKYGETITAPETAGSRTGYTWCGWNIGEVTMGSSGASFNAKDHGTWTANTYTVSFHANGGEGTMDAQHFTYDVTGILTANSFTRAGYTFAGWSTMAEGDAIHSDQTQVSNLATSGNVDLYAQWTAGTGTGYTVNYYGENLTGTGYEVIHTVTSTGVTGSAVTATELSLSGFTFDSENTKNITTGTIAGDGSLILELYYNRNSYTLTLDFNGESMKQAVENDSTYKMELVSFDIADKEISVKYGQTLADVLTGITIYGIVQESGWTTDPETGENVYIDDDVYGDVSFETAFPGYTFNEWKDCPTTMPAGELKLTADWTPIAVTVTFYANYGTNYGNPLTKTYSYGDVIDLSYTPSDYGFTREDYFIPGWSYGAIVTSGAVITGELVLVDGYHYSYSCAYSVSGGGEGENLMKPGEVHIYAFWSSETHRSTIAFNGNGASNIAQYTQDVDGSGYYFTALLKNVYIREGYTFTGWNTAADGTGDFYSDEDMSVMAWKDETILYAQWKAISS